MKEIIKKAKLFAINAHFQVNHKYDGNEYFIHLQSVYKFAVKYQHLINPDILVNVLAACWLHDTIEDARLTYNDIKKDFGFDIAELVFALTNEKGRVRDDRANDKYYEEMREVEGAVFIKLCDRLANTEYSFNSKSGMIKKYKKEYPHFKHMLYNVSYDEMFIELEKYYK